MRYKTSRSMVHAEREVTRVGMGPLALGVWLWPWAASLTLMPLAALLWAAWGREPGAKGWAAAGVVLAVVGLTTLAWRAGAARGSTVRWHATVYLAVAGAWLLMAMLTKPWSRPTIDLWAAFVIVGAMSWNIRHALRGTSDGSNGWDALAERLKLPGSRVFNIGREGYRTTATVEVAPGAQTAADIAAARPQIASLLRVPTSAVRTEPDPDDAARAKLTVISHDLLSTPIPWSGPARRGASIAEFIALGNREGGEPLGLWLPGDQRISRSATHVLITGMTGAAKSWTGRILDVEIASRFDTELVIIDITKGSQYLRPFVGVDRVTTIGQHDPAKAYIGALPQLITDRADELGRRGYDEWEPGCGLPYLVVHVEEAWALLAKSRPGARAAQAGRSAGCSLIVSLQRAVHTNLEVDIRQQIGAVLAFGCEPGDERYSGLSPAVLAAGAAPQNWGNSRPGYCYAEVPGVEERLWHLPARAARAERRDIMAALGTLPAGQDHQVPASVPTSSAVPAQPTPATHRVSPADAQTMFLARLRELRDEGVVEVRPAHFEAMLNAAGRSQPWLTAALKQVVEKEVLLPRSRGVYEFNSAARSSSARPDPRA